MLKNGQFFYIYLVELNIDMVSPGGYNDVAFSSLLLLLFDFPEFELSLPPFSSFSFSAISDSVFESSAPEFLVKIRNILFL
jgi:hypothetical protein